MANARTAGRRLGETRARYRALVDQIPAITYLASADQPGTALYISSQIEPMLGFSSKEWLSNPRSWSERLHPADRDRVLAAAVRLRETGQPLSIDYRMQTRDGRFLWFRDEAVVVRDHAGKPILVQGVVFDITDYRRAHEALEESQHRLQALFDNALDAILLADGEGRYLDANPAACELLEFTRAELMQLTPWEITPETNRAAAQELWRQFLADGQQSGDFPLRRRDGAVVHIQYRAVANIVPGVHLSILRDVTERRRAEEALRQREEYFRALVEHAFDVTAVVGADVGIHYVTPSVSRMLGYEPEELIGQSALDLIHPDDVDAVAKIMSGLLENLETPTRFETRALHKDGTTRYIEATDTNLLEHPAVRGIVANTRDVTERKRAEAEHARRAAQLQALADTSLAIGLAQTVEEIAEIATVKARKIIGAHQSATSFTTDSSWAQALQHVSLSDRYAAWRTYDVRPEGSGIYALVCRTNRPVRLAQEELEAHPSWRGFGREAGKHPPMRGWLAAPLVARDGHNLGLIQLSDKHEGDFTEEDEAILVQLAQLVSVAVENTRLLQQVIAGRQRLQGLSRRLLEVQESERRHLARELHDEVGQLLTGFKLTIEMAASDPTATTVASTLNEARELAMALIDRVRDLSLNLRPGMLDDLGLLPALVWHCERFAAQTGLRVRLEHDSLDAGRLAPAVETAAYRIAQEALTNVARHAEVEEAVLRLWADTDKLTVQIEDAGVGFNPEKQDSARSVGLSGMRERALYLGGRLNIESAPGDGTRVTAELPIERHPPSARSAQPEKQG